MSAQETAETFDWIIYCEMISSSFMVHGIRTEFIVRVCESSVLLLVTQLDKVGTVVQCEKETSSDGGIVFSTRVLIGKREDPLVDVFSRQIIESISKDHPDVTSMIVGLALLEGFGLDSLRVVLDLSKKLILSESVQLF